MDLSKTRQHQKENLLKTARDLILEKGINKTTVSDIAKSAQVDRKTFYNYYSDKESLLEDLIQLSERNNLFDLLDIPDIGSGHEQLRQLLYGMYDHVLTQDSFMILSSEFDDLHKDYHIFLGASNEDNLITSDIYKLVEKGIKDGSIDPKGQTVTELLASVFIPIFSCFQKYHKHHEPFKNDFGISTKSLKNVIDIILEGIKGTSISQ